MENEHKPEREHGELFQPLEICLGHITGNCKECKYDERNKECKYDERNKNCAPRYKPAAMWTFNVVPKDRVSSSYEDKTYLHMDNPLK